VTAFRRHSPQPLVPNKMNKTKDNLTFEIQGDESEKELMIHGSAEGLKRLAKSLLSLVENTKEGEFDHDHLMTEEWGGCELTSEKKSKDSELINHVKVYCWKD